MNRPVGGPPIRVLVVDDHEVARRTAARALTVAAIRAEVAGSVAEARARLDERRDWCGLMADHHLPDDTGLALAREVRARFPGLPIAIMTGDDEVANDVIAAGLRFLRKPFGLAHLEPYVEEVRDYARGPDGPRVGRFAERRGLPPRELDVLRRLVAGKSDRAVASELRIAPSTARTHRRRIYDRAGVRTLDELLALLEREDG